MKHEDSISRRAAAPADLFSQPDKPFHFHPDPFGRRPVAVQTRDLFAARGSRDRRPAVDDLVPRMIAALDQRGWVAAKTLGPELQVDARALREAANQSKGRILGNSKGYILCVQACLQDVHAVTRRLLSQSNRMRVRVAEIERVRHSSCGDIGSVA